MKNQFLTKQVTKDLRVVVIPDRDHEFLMISAEVAKGYGVSRGTLRQCRRRHPDEFIEGKHFIRGVTICNANSVSGVTNWDCYSKNGVVRLGFLLKSPRAKIFRDWAEDLIINAMERKLPALPSPLARHHNRLTPARLVDMMSDICRIEDSQIRISLVNKLMG
jgi:hypothetical protein